MSIISQLEQTFLVEEVDPERTIRLDSSHLVREIKKHPIIYDNSLRRDQTSTFKAWESICSNMLPNFATMSENEKFATRKRLRDRWSYMRSTFRRDIFSDNIKNHRRFDWVNEMNFMIPILTRPTDVKKYNQNSMRRGKRRELSEKKQTQSKTTSTITSNTIVTSPSNTTEIEIEKIPESTPVNITESSLSDVISCDSNSSDKSSNLDLTSQTTEIITEEKSRNDLMVETFMSAFNSDAFLTQTVDADQMFLLTVLQNYRLVRSDRKVALQHKFYTFLRD